MIFRGDHHPGVMYSSSLRMRLASRSAGSRTRNAQAGLALIATLTAAWLIVAGIEAPFR
jgi:hypothetical protein